MRPTAVLCAALAALSCTPAPKGPPPPAPDIKRQQVRILSDAGIQLAGELTVPSDLKPGERRPGIVLIAGTGPTDKDYSLFTQNSADGSPLHLYLQVSDALTRAGFIVLRYDKRGVLRPLGDTREFLDH